MKTIECKKMLKKVIVIDPLDNVATAITKLEAGSVITVRIGQSEKKVEVIQLIPFGHKVALRRIEKDGNVIKYGEAIGKAMQVIEEGEHVHIHNVESLRARGDIT